MSVVMRSWSREIEWDDYSKGEGEINWTNFEASIVDGEILLEVNDKSDTVRARLNSRRLAILRSLLDDAESHLDNEGNDGRNSAAGTSRDRLFDREAFADDSSPESKA